MKQTTNIMIENKKTVTEEQKQVNINDLEGILLINKPKGVTSNYIVQTVKKKSNRKKLVIVVH
jgi:tRNA U55 pseudouridine synthase TruB